MLVVGGVRIVRAGFVGVVIGTVVSQGVMLRPAVRVGVGAVFGRHGSS
jgi:hypothetical protein